MVKRKGNTKNIKQNSALLIDGENISAKKVDKIMRVVRTKGILYEGKVYGRQKDPYTKSWSNKAGEYGIKDIRLYGDPKKNKVDKKLKKDGRRLVEEHKNIDIIYLASNDGDYTEYVKDMRSRGKRVVVFGGKQASTALKKSCNLFVEI